MARCTGVVKFYNAAQNLGGIERDTNSIYKEAALFTTTDLPKGLDDLPAGQKVSYDRFPHNNRIWATNIVLI